MGLPQLLFSLKHAAQLTGLSPSTLRFYCWQGRLRGTRPGRNWLVSRQELERFFGIKIDVQDRELPRRKRRRKRVAATATRKRASR